MASTYSTSLKIQLIGNGDQAGVWGTTTNNNWNLVEQAISGVGSITMTNADYTLSNLNGVIDEARNAVIVVNGTNSDVRKVIIPLVEKNYDMTNNTVGGYAITVGGVTGSYITIPNGGSMAFYCDGVNTYFANTMATTPARGDNSNLIATTAFVQDSLPSGMIMLWYGSVASIPSGWIICDGANGTPDLRNRFILGAGNSYAPGATGGSEDAIVVSHNHTVTVSGSTASSGTGQSVNGVGDHDHPYGFWQTGSGGGGINGSPSGDYFARNTGGGGAHSHSLNDPGHSHSVSISGTTSTSGSSGIGANMPPYYALCYVMKV